MNRSAFQEFGMRFEALCALFFQELDFLIERNIRLKRGLEIDLIARRDDKIVYIVEVKALTKQRADLSMLRDVVVQARMHLRMSDVDQGRGLLIVSAEVDAEHRSWLKAEFHIELWDRQHLIAHARSPLREQFENFFAELDRQEGSASWPSAEANSVGSAFEQVTKAGSRGRDFCRELRRLQPGKATAKTYESLMEEILEYLFGDYLLDPKSQRRLEDDLSILDLTYRVKPTHPFWDTLTRDLRARVMVFEFKNYEEPIRPTQVYSTERYIHVGALRPICFIISRKKPHRHALRAAAGAIREAGKLMILLSDDDICKMLDLRDAQLRIVATSHQYFQNDPTIVLDERIYEVLSTLPR